MAIVTQTDKRTGIIYAYETIYHWDKEKKQSRSKRTCIGKVDLSTGNIIPTRGKAKKGELKAVSTVSTNSAFEKLPYAKHLYYGATYLFETFAKDIGVTKDLEQCFPETYKQILSIAFYLILSDSSPLYRFEKWNATHKHPYGKDITSPKSSELFAAISDDQINQFFRLQAKRRIKEEYWAYDTTSFSSYSDGLEQVQWGKNKENDELPQINLLLVFGEKSGLPFYYRKLAGNIPDFKTVHHYMEELNILEIGAVKLVLDRAFHTRKTIDAFFANKTKFLVGAKLSTRLVKDTLDSAYDDIRQFKNYDQATKTYGCTIRTVWNYKQEYPDDCNNPQEKPSIDIHLFFNRDKQNESNQVFDDRLATLKEELLSGKLVAKNKKAYTKFFEEKEVPDNGTQILEKEDAIEKERKYFGYFAILTNESMSAPTALHIYRMKDLVEKAFGNMKEKLDLRRLLVKSEKALDGKLFVSFVALILISHLDHKMKEAKLYQKYSMLQLLDKLDVIECFENENHKLRVGEILKQQEDIYNALGVPVLTSSSC